MKFKKDSDHWPKDSLKRSLLMNFPGCKNSVEAMLKQKSSQTPSEYKTMCQIIIDIEKALDGYDIDLMDFSMREKLSLMPLRNIGEALLWKDAWMEVLKRLKRD